MQKGLIHIYYGDGKGKTTAALGLGLRAAGQGLRVYLTRFLKSSDSGEISALKTVKNFETADAPAALPFYFELSEREKTDYKKYARGLWKAALERARTQRADVLIFDEILAAVSLEILDLNEVLEFLQSKPYNVEVVLTGHDAPAGLINIADYVSHITAEKHPFEKGVTARKGIEY